jgi:hypothetical protein
MESLATARKITICYDSSLKGCLQMPVDVTAILVSSTFMGAGLALAKFFPESSLLAAFFLGGLALVNIGLSIAG